MTRRPALLALFAILVASPVSGQLRPLEPAQWEVFEPGARLAAWVGGAVHADQRASLAGTEGTLLELGSFQATWRSGRIAVEAAGTALRRLDERSRFAPPYGDARDDAGPTRSDSGDYRLLTTVLLTPPGEPTALAARFGTRLPTTDNRVGLDRDQTDFFGLVAGRARAGRARLTAETGIGIYGTRDPDFEQSDLWIYAAGAELPLGFVTASAAVLGQMDWSAGEPLRGNEDLSELRVGARIAGPLAFQAQLVRGLTDFSPGLGLVLSVGWTR